MIPTWQHFRFRSPEPASAAILFYSGVQVPMAPSLRRRSIKLKVPLSCERMRLAETNREGCRSSSSATTVSPPSRLCSRCPDSRVEPLPVSRCRVASKHTRTNAATQVNLVPSQCALNIGMTSEGKLETVTCLCKLSHTSQLLQSRTQFCSTSDLAKSHSRQTHRGSQATPHDVVPPQTGPRVSHGSHDGIGGQMCRSCSIRRGTTGRRQHHDQDHPIRC